MSAARAKAPTMFIKKSELARELCIDRKTIDRGIADGTFPPPHSRPRPTLALWLRAHFDHYVATRQWPAGAFPPRDG